MDGPLNVAARHHDLLAIRWSAALTAAGMIGRSGGDASAGQRVVRIRFAVGRALRDPGGDLHARLGVAGGGRECRRGMLGMIRDDIGPWLAWLVFQPRLP